MVRSAVAAVMLALAAQPAPATEGAMRRDLAADLRPGQSALLEVTVGAIAKGQEVEVTTADGRLVGTVSPFGIRPGAEAGTYTMPVPTDAVRDGTLSLRLRISQPDGPPRAPTMAEVKDIRLTVIGPPR